MNAHSTSTAPTHTEELEHVDQVLEEATTTRRAQLDRLSPAADDPVGIAQQAALRQTLAEIGAARERIARGRFGTCTACRGPISPERLEFRPWSATCVRCAGR